MWFKYIYIRITLEKPLYTFPSLFYVSSLIKAKPLWPNRREKGSKARQSFHKSVSGRRCVHYPLSNAQKCQLTLTVLIYYRHFSRHLRGPARPGCDTSPSFCGDQIIPVI